MKKRTAKCFVVGRSGRYQKLPQLYTPTKTVSSYRYPWASASLRSRMQHFAFGFSFTQLSCYSYRPTSAAFPKEHLIGSSTFAENRLLRSHWHSQWHTKQGRLLILQCHTRRYQTAASKWIETWCVPRIELVK